MDYISQIKRRFVQQAAVLCMVIGFVGAAGLTGCGFSSDSGKEAELYEELSVEFEELSQEIAEDSQELGEETEEVSEEEILDSVPGDAGDSSETEGKSATHLKLTVLDTGYDVYAPKRVHDYRYGPSILLNDDGSMDVWFAAPGDSVNEYDWIVYTHSEDGGETWSEHKAVLSPTPCSFDYRSVCDPDVFYYNGYYYLGYTATISESFKGFSNSVFLARSKRPDGPFEKWNGDGWGGSPKPILYYDGPGIGWGRGEPSFVIKDDILFAYITMDAYTADFVRIRSTEVYNAPLDSEDFPKNLVFQGYALNRTDTGEEAEYSYSDCDSLDVAYVEELGKFVAVSTNRRFQKDSCLLYFESDDGYRFERVSELNTNVICGAHNCGLMSDGQGHIKPEDPTLLGYAYAGSGNGEWGSWVTRFAPIRIEETDEPDREEDGKENVRQAIAINGKSSTEPLMLNAKPLQNAAVVGAGSFQARYFYVDSLQKKHYIDASELTFSDYDKEIISVENGTVMPLRAGSTTALIEYGGLYRQLSFTVLDQAVSGNGAVTELLSEADSYSLSKNQSYAVSVRPLVRFEDGRLLELSDRRLTEFGIAMESSDESICTVREDFTLIPVSAGETTVTVSCSAGLRYRVRVKVTE
ncbi:MAG: hypothetical protein IJ873_00725 [Lachnospiraceae bacterium]|nr:hypothetical protein [Lachnospiraceae bacterium]